VGRVGERVAAARPRRGREVAVDVEERGPRDMPREVLATAPVGIVERPAAVDEDVAHPRKLERSSAAETPDAARSTALDHHSVVFRQRLAERGVLNERAPLEQNDVAPRAVQLADPLPRADDPEAATAVQGERGLVLWEDAGLKRPHARGLRVGDQMLEQGPPD